MPASADTAPSRRIAAIDIARGLALLAMALYHLTWDMEYHGYVARGLTADGGWKLFARAIASSFLFLAGVSLALAHGDGIRWRPFLKRLLQIVAGAALITLATWYVTPNAFVFFGILHQIALASILAILLLRLHWSVIAILAIAVIALPTMWSTSLTDSRMVAWIGFAEKPPLSNDFVPLFPWFGAVLLGLAAGKMANARSYWNRLRGLNDRLRRFSPLGWLGRHSLSFYLLHQPILFGLVLAFSQLWPPDRAASFDSECVRVCLPQRDQAFCARYCDCAQRELADQDLLNGLMNGALDAARQSRAEETLSQCSFSAEPGTG